ncbi:MAG: hypothetical protein NTY98_03230 [Verrucomicrobia bacterium]|nr:hypothetical protein [Verrucomicrobiota bacterium]
MHEGLAALLRSKFKTSLTPEDFPPLSDYGRWWFVLGFSYVQTMALASLYALVLRLRDPASLDHSPLLYVLLLLLPCHLLFSFVQIGHLLLKSDRMKRPVAHEPVRLRRLGLALKVAGGVLYIGSFHDFGVGEQFMLCWGGAFFLYAGYRLSVRNATIILQGDDRAPAVYLRSFGDDGKNNLNPDTLAGRILGLRRWGVLTAVLGPIADLYFPRLFRLSLGHAADTAEEQLATLFRRQGPFVAIGKPGEWIATPGAERLYVSHDTWQNTVLQLLSSCALVVVQPARTQGVWWEIETCLQQVPTGRLLLCFAGYGGGVQAYEEFRMRFEELSGIMLPRTLCGAQFLWFEPGGRACLLPSRFRTPLLWPLVGVGLNLEATLWPCLSHAYPQDFRVVPRPERPCLFALGKVLAVLLWPPFFFCLPYVFRRLL